MNPIDLGPEKRVEWQAPEANRISVLLSKVLDHLLPRHCVACGHPSGPGNLCRPCSNELPRDQPSCRLCGLRLPVHTDPICGVCLGHPPPWQAATAALAYRFPVDRLVCRFKFGRDLACGQILGAELLATITRHNGALPQILVPVPLHRARRWARSFNQAEMLARQVGRGLGIPVDTRLLSRFRRTSAQSGLDARARKRNIKAAFSCRPTNYRHIALVDDVMTTGATLAECTRVLQRAGVDRVSVWVAARANFKAGH